MNEFRKAITAVAEHALALSEHGRAVFKITGVDALDLLHRLSTNDLLNGSGAQAIPTLFCNEKGRVVESAEVVSTRFDLPGQNESDRDLSGHDLSGDDLSGDDLSGDDLSGNDLSGDDLFLICSTAGSQTLIRWIDRFTFTENIHLDDVSDVFSVDCIIGPHAFQRLEDIGPVRGHVWEGRFGSLPCVRILSARDRRAEILGRLQGKRITVVESARAYEFLRVLHSVPLFGHEIVDSYNPYEVGLTHAISFSKGCYIGQEIIARLDTYKKVQRQLRMLWSDTSDVPQPGTPVIVTGEQAGAVTSSTSGLGKTIVLAVLRNEAIRPHEVFRISDFPYILNDAFPPPYSLIFRQDRA